MLMWIQEYDTDNNPHPRPLSLKYGEGSRVLRYSLLPTQGRRVRDEGAKVIVITIC